MNLKFLAIFLLLLAVPATGNEQISMRVTPTLSVEPAVIRVRVAVEPNDDNRTLEIVAESSDYFRSSQIDIDGASAARMNQFEYRGLPAGTYTIRSTVFGRNGRQRASTQNEITVVP